MINDRPFHVLGVSGSLREQSRGIIALRMALDFAAERGAEKRLLDLREVDLPLYRPDREGHSRFEECFPIAISTRRSRPFALNAQPILMNFGHLIH